MDGYSLNDLLNFQDYLSRTGMANPNTSASRKAAAGKILGSLEPDERQDVRKVDLDSAFARWVNKNPGIYNPSSMQVYLSRVKSAIQDFSRYKENPAAYKPVAPVIRKAPAPRDVQRPVMMRLREQVLPEVSQASSGYPSLGSYQPTSGVSLNGTISGGQGNTVGFSVPIRSGVYAQLSLSGLPKDLTPGEATKSAKFIATMVESMLVAGAQGEAS